MARLAQIIAVEKGIKAKTMAELTEAHHALQKPALLAGISRTYRPKDDEGEQLPSESTIVQVRADDLVKRTAEILARFWDVTATKDHANCEARADIKLPSGRVLAERVPVTHLLFLEKQLIDVHTFLRKLPVLAADEKWAHDDAHDCWATEPADTTRTKKILRNHVKAEATDNHPAQVEVFSEDQIVGYWKTVKFSGALPQKRVTELVERVQVLQQAVKYAREEANTIEAKPMKEGGAIFDYLFA